jgi:hypothetical protein
MKRRTSDSKDEWEKIGFNLEDMWEEDDIHQTLQEGPLSTRL